MQGPRRCDVLSCDYIDGVWPMACIAGGEILQHYEKPFAVMASACRGRGGSSHCWQGRETRWRLHVGIMGVWQVSPSGLAVSPTVVVSMMACTAIGGDWEGLWLPVYVTPSCSFSIAVFRRRGLVERAGERGVPACYRSSHAWADLGPCPPSPSP